MKQSEIVHMPHAMGHEEEVGLSITIDGKRARSSDVASIVTCVPAAMAGHKQVLGNGGRFYVSDQPEICTPEVKTARDATAYIRANEQILVETTAQYLTEGGLVLHDITSASARARIQRRTVDGHGIRWGPHDNFGVHPALRELFQSDPDAQETLHGHFKTQSVITGAGYITASETSFAQKVGGLVEVENHGRTGCMFSFKSEEGLRLEHRFPDTNLSDWATYMRFGGMVLSIGISQTPEYDKLRGPDIKHVIRETIKSNKLELTPDATLVPSERLLEDLDYQHRKAEYALHTLPEYIEMTPEYLDVAKELHEFCEDAKKVVAGDATIALLADRADWAAKLYVIHRKVEADKANGLDRTMNDAYAQAQDMSYDVITLRTIDGELQEPVYGWGYRLRDKGVFRKTISQDKVDSATTEPPTDTRASLRSQLVKKYQVNNANWTGVTLKSEQPSGRYQYPRIDLNDVLQTEFTEEQRAIMDVSVKKPDLAE